MIAKNPDPHRVRSDTVIDGVVVHERAIGDKTRVSLWKPRLLGNRIRNELLKESVKVVRHSRYYKVHSGINPPLGGKDYQLAIGLLGPY